MLIGLSVVVALAGLEWAGRWPVSAPVPTGDASWIWAAESARGSTPVAFYLFRDFDYPEELAAGSEALLLLSVDEQYRLWVNGFCVAAGGVRRGGALDEIEVGGVLRTGRNRLLLEVRSRSGAGGVLASLGTARGGEPVLVSDSSWSVARRHEPGLIEGFAFPSEPEKAIVWRRPVTGRWSRPRLDPQGEVLDARVAAFEESRADAHQWAGAVETVSTRMRRGGADGEDLQIPAVLIDFGEPVRGELELWLEADPSRAYALELSLDGPPTGPVDPGRLEGGIPSPEQPVVVLVPGRSWWRDTTVREFRWARLVGVADVGGARVRLSEVAAPPDDDRPWLFGIEPRRPGAGDELDR